MKFSGTAETPTGYNNDGRDCHSKRLAEATPINVKYLKDFVDTLFAIGTDYKLTKGIIQVKRSEN